MWSSPEPILRDLAAACSPILPHLPAARTRTGGVHAASGRSAEGQGKRWLIRLYYIRRLERGQGDANGGSLADDAVNGDDAVVGLDDLSTDCQPQARPALAARTRRLNTVKALEEVRQMFRGDSLAGVCHGRDDVGLVLPQRQRDLAVRPRVARGVGEQIGEDLQQRLGVPLDRRGIFGDADADSPPGPPFG